MAKKSGLTPMGRLIIFLLIGAPLAYIGASYYNGEDGVQNIKNLVSGNKTENTIEIDPETPRVPTTKVDSDATTDKYIEQVKENEILARKVMRLEEEKAKLERELARKQQEIADLKSQVDHIE